MYFVIESIIYRKLFILVLVLDTVITGESLFELIGAQNPDLLLVDTRSFAEYNKGHIPGAINIDLMNFHWFDTSKQGILQFNRQMGLLLNMLALIHKFCNFL